MGAALAGGWGGWHKALVVGSVSPWRRPLASRPSTFCYDKQRGGGGAWHQEASRTVNHHLSSPSPHRTNGSLVQYPDFPQRVQLLCRVHSTSLLHSGPRTPIAQAGRGGGGGCWGEAQPYATGFAGQRAASSQRERVPLGALGALGGPRLGSQRWVFLLQWPQPGAARHSASVWHLGPGRP